MIMNHNNENMELILNGNVFFLPSDFSSLTDVNEMILLELTIKKKYEVKSNVTKDILKGFINHWVYGNIPNFNLDNIGEYELLSKEFERMERIIKEFKKKPISSSTFSLLKKNEKKYNDKCQKLKDQTKKYARVIETLFKNSKFTEDSSFLIFKDELFEACKKEKITTLELLTRPKVINNGIWYVLNENDHSASVFKDYDAENDVEIPKDIEYKNKLYDVTEILENAFNGSIGISSIQFPEDSKLALIDNKAFTNSSIEYICIPANVTRIGVHAFSYCKNLKKVDFKENSKLQQIADYAFSNSSIEKMEFPKSVKHIGSYVFSLCSKIDFVTFPSNSELESIDKESFIYSSIKNISLPSSCNNLIEECFNGTPELSIFNIIKNKVENIISYKNDFILGKSDKSTNNFDVLLFARRNIQNAIVPPFIKHVAAGAFHNCRLLQSVIFSKDSKLESIGREAFNYSSISTLVIPSSIRELKECWCEGISRLINLKVIPCDEKNIILYKGEYLLGKSDLKNDKFDNLLFGCRNIKSVVIPSFIKNISSCAFECCKLINDIEILNNSELQTIGQKAFMYSSITKIKIPKNVIKIDKMAFMNCSKLKRFECSNDSKLKIIGEYAFSFSKVEQITIPSSVLKLEVGWINDANSLSKINITQSEQSNILCYNNSFIIGKSDVSNDKFDVIICALKNIYSVSIPSFIKKIEKFAFYECEKLYCVDIPENSQLESLGESAFSYSGIECIYIPEHVSHIGKHAFYECTNLTMIEFSEKSKLYSVDKTVFEDSPLKIINNSKLN